MQNKVYNMISFFDIVLYIFKYNNFIFSHPLSTACVEGKELIY
jgi:hypothetical protein